VGLALHADGDERHVTSVHALGLHELSIPVVVDEVRLRRGRVGRVRMRDERKHVGRLAELERERAVRPLDDARVRLLDRPTLGVLGPPPADRAADLPHELLGLAALNLVGRQLHVLLEQLGQHRVVRLLVEVARIRHVLVVDRLWQPKQPALRGEHA
jgi:hypothetical protein